MNLNEKDIAPDFELPDQNGNLVRLSKRQGQWVLVYFYPKDDTPGCTKEACSFSSRLPDFTQTGLQVLGISPDSVAKHKEFSDKYKLTITLLADENKSVVRLYGVWGKKSFMGKEFMGVIRSSFLVDPQGRIAKVYLKVNPAEHAAEVWNDINQFLRT